MLVTFRKQNNDNETQIKIRADPMALGAPRITNRPRFNGQPIVEESILSAARFMSTEGMTTSTPKIGSSLTINGEAVGNYDYYITGTTTISSFTGSAWFTSTQDTASAWVIVNGNLTINTGITMIPPVRKLFTVVYVRGNLTLTGTGRISMTARGANHSGTGTSGGYTAPVDIRIGTGTFSAVTDPQIPATGASGGPAFSGSNGKNNGSTGTDGATGGGGSGYRFSAGTSGAGSAGTCFTGGTGGGGAISGTASAGEINGGKGGDRDTSPSSGGTGNPGGNQGAGIYQGTEGTGGVLIVICEGTLSGSGSFQAQGVEGQRFDSGRIGGGSSGGGSITVLYQTDSSTTTLSAAGGADRSGNTGGGGAGTTRKLDIGSN